MTENIPQIWSTFPQSVDYINFDKKWVWLHLGQFFHKLVWSPWPQTVDGEGAMAETNVFVPQKIASGKNRTSAQTVP
jgi:hypothetical protein